MEFKYKLTQEDFKIILEKSWTRETSADPEGWEENNASWGQCAVSSPLAQDIFGGQIVWAEAKLPKGEGISHYFNRINNKEKDFTRIQFPTKTIIPKGIEKKKEFDSTREYILSFEATKNRYNLLKEKFKENMDIWSEPMKTAWELAEKHSKCKKMNFGAILVKDEHIISEGFNHPPHKFLEDICEPECIREGVLSGTKGELYSCVHAERDAVIGAYQNGFSNLSNATIYIAGKFPDGKKLIKDSPSFYCTSCAVAMARDGIDNIIVPTLQGEAILSIEEILKSSFDVALQKRDAY